DDRARGLGPAGLDRRRLGGRGAGPGRRPGAPPRDGQAGPRLGRGGVLGRRLGRDVRGLARRGGAGRRDRAPRLCLEPVGPRGLRLDEWRRDGQLTVVKTGPHRVVYRAELAEGAVYVKHFLVPGLRAKVRQWFRRGKGRNEGRRTRYLSAIGVPTITPIALGE